MNILKNIQYYSITYIQAYWHLLILSWLDCGPRYFLGKTRASKFKVVLYLYEQLLKIFFLMAMLNIWYTYTCKIIQIQNGINIRASGKKNKNLLIQDLFSRSLSRYSGYDFIKLILLCLFLLRWAMWLIHLLLWTLIGK